MRFSVPGGRAEEDRAWTGDLRRIEVHRVPLLPGGVSVQRAARYEWTKLVPYVKKCDMCAARQVKGERPACVEACPTEASIVGRRDEMLEEAQRRVLNDSKYVKHIYGSEEAGGTSVFFISDVPFEKLGFVAAPRQPMPALSAAALGDVPTVVLVGGSLLAGLYWITERRNQVAAAETRERSPMQR